MGRGEQERRMIKAAELLLCSTPRDRPQVFILSVEIGTLCLEVTALSTPSAWPVPGYHLSRFLL